MIVKNDIMLRRNDAGVVTMGLRDFLMNADSLEGVEYIVALEKEAKIAVLKKSKG